MVAAPSGLSVKPAETVAAEGAAAAGAGAAVLVGPPTGRGVKKNLCSRS